MRRLFKPGSLEKEDVAGHFHRFPSLEKLVLVLLFDRRFRWVILALALLLVSLALVLLPWWPLDTPGMPSLHRVKPIDLWQAIILRRSAEAELADGHIREGLMSWRAAVSKNPGDLGLLRGFIRQLTLHGDPRRHTGMALHHSQWLLRVGQTNQEDLQLIVRLCDRFLLDDYLLYVLGPLEGQLSPELEAAYAKALFVNREPSRFVTSWARVEKQLGTTSHPELALLHHAYLAGWTDGASATAGQKALDQAKQDDKLQLLAYRLQLVVSERQRDLKGYGDALEVVQQRGATRLIDHLVHWTLLRDAGQKDTVIELMQSNVYEPRSGDEVVLLARSYYELGRADEAREVLRQYAHRFFAADHVWLSLANLLAAQERWEDLRGTAMQLRSQPGAARTDLLALSHYLEGLAELGRHHQATGAAAFQKAAQTPIDSKVLLMKMAEGMERAGYSDCAQARLLNSRNLGENDPEYWRLLSKTAYQLRDAALLTYATSAVHRLQPHDPIALQNYAAALLTSRSLPEEAVALTLECYRRQPRNPAAILNHAAALAQNRRLAEAKGLLQALQNTTLPQTDANSLNLVWFEVHVEEGDLAAALELEKRIDRKLLFPPELSWLHNALERISGAARRRDAGTTNSAKT